MSYTGPDYMKRGREAYENDIEEPPGHLSADEERSWRDGWIDAAAEDPESDVSWEDAGFPNWEN